MPIIVHAYVDAANLWEAQKAKGRHFDLEKLTNYLKTRYKADDILVHYYTAYPAAGTRDYDTTGKHRFYTYLKKGLGFVVRKKELKRIVSSDSTHADGFIEKGNMDVELTIDAVNNVSKFSTAILFTGDSDFLGLVRFLRARSKKVYIFSSRNNISSELRTGADGYTDLLNITEDIWRDNITYRGQNTDK